MRILIADDQAEVRLALKILLDQKGYEVVGEAAGPESALSAARDTKPDLMLLDWELEGFRPAELIPVIRRLMPGMKIIAMSVRPEAAKAAPDAGADAFVSKGDNSERLLETINKI